MRPPARSVGPTDTDPDAERVLLDVYRSMSPARKLELVADGWECARALAWAGLRQRHPDAGENELFRRFVELVLGAELAARAYGPLERWR